MYPFWSDDPTISDNEKKRISLDDILASEMLQSAPNKFVILDGTYIELSHHITSLESKVGKIRSLRLQTNPQFDIVQFLEESKKISREVKWN